MAADQAEKSPLSKPSLNRSLPEGVAVAVDGIDVSVAVGGTSVNVAVGVAVLVDVFVDRGVAVLVDVNVAVVIAVEVAV